MRSSNTCLNSRRLLNKALAGLMAALALCGVAKALDPNRTLSQYSRNQWTIEGGFPGGTVYGIAQTPDGYLWIAAENGLVRFDGIEFRLFDHARFHSLPPGPMLSLITDAKGDLWVRPQNPGLLRYREGAFVDMAQTLGQRSFGVTAMARGQNGDLVLAGLGGPFRYSEGKITPLTGANLLVLSLAETGGGRVWIGTRDAGLRYLLRGEVYVVTEGVPDRKINCLLATGERQLWIGTDSGLVQWNGAQVSRTGVPAELGNVPVLALAKDRELNLWIAAARGLYRLNGSGLTAPGSLLLRAGSGG